MIKKKAILTTKEVAAILEISTPTVYKYIKEKKLLPIYKDSWQIDETHLFKREDVMLLKDKLTKPGLTTGEVARKLNVHPTTVASYIKKGDLKATKQFYQGRNMYFIQNDDVIQFQKNHPKQQYRKQKAFYHKRSHLYLFQKVKHIQTHELGRVMELSDNHVKIWKENGEVLSSKPLQLKDFFPMEMFLDKEYITKRGYVTFCFSTPSSFDDPFFSVIELFYREISHRNIRINKKRDHIQLKVKPCHLRSMKEDETASIISTLKKSIQKGTIIIRHDGLVLESDIEVLNISLSADLKASLKDLASAKHLNMEQYVRNLIEREIDENKNISS